MSGAITHNFTCNIKFIYILFVFDSYVCLFYCIIYMCILLFFCYVQINRTENLLYCLQHILGQIEPSTGWQNAKESVCWCTTPLKSATHTHTHTHTHKTQRRTALFCVIKQRSCSETSVRNNHYSLRNNPEERSPHLVRGGILKSRKIQWYWIQFLCNVELSTPLYNLYLQGLEL